MFKKNTKPTTNPHFFPIKKEHGFSISPTINVQKGARRSSLGRHLDFSVTGTRWPILNS